MNDTLEHYKFIIDLMKFTMMIFIELQPVIQIMKHSTLQSII